MKNSGPGAIVCVGCCCCGGGENDAEDGLSFPESEDWEGFMTLPR